MVTFIISDYTDSFVSNEDGMAVFVNLRPIFEREKTIVVSFKGIHGVPSSFVNSAFVELLHHYPFDCIKSKLSFVDTNKQINAMLKKRFEFEAKRIVPAMDSCPL